MAARILRLALLIELLIYLALACVLARFARWEWTDALLAVFALALALRALAVAGSFAIAARHASPAPPEHRLGPWAWLKVFTGEFGAAVAIFNLYQPFEQLLLGDDAPRALTEGRLPVLLLHGYCCNRGFMLALRRHLRACGIGAYTHNLEPVYADIDAYAEPLARRVDEICAAAGAARLVIVAHSMGGLAARAYMRKYGPGRVAKLITLGTPHQGTASARLGLGQNARQMVPGSDWLARLNQVATGVPVVAVFSYQDNVVVPQENAALAGMERAPVSGVGHLAMAFSPRIRAIVLAELAGY